MKFTIPRQKQLLFIVETNGKCLELFDTTRFFLCQNCVCYKYFTSLAPTFVCDMRQNTKPYSTQFEENKEKRLKFAVKELREYKLKRILNEKSR